MIIFNIKRTFQHFNSTRLITIGSFLSLILGILSALFIYKWIFNELSMNRFHENADQIYLTAVNASPMSELDLIDASMFHDLDYDQYPGIEKTLKLIKVPKEEVKLSLNQKEFTGEAMVADSTFFDFFDFPLQSGNGKNILADPGNIILTKSYAEKIFGNERAIGKSLVFKSPVSHIYKIAGIIDEVPANSSIKFDFIVPYHSAHFPLMGAEFLLVNKHFIAEEFNREIAQKGRSHPQYKESILSVIPFTSIYFNHHFQNSTIFNKYGDEKVILLFFIIGAIVLLISLLNFINLQTTAFTFRLKGIAINKVSGATWSNVVNQIFVERLLMAVLAAGFILFLHFLLLPFFIEFLNIELPSRPAQDAVVVFSATVLFSLLSVLVSLFQLHKFNILEAIRHKHSGSFKVIGKEAMVIFQFVFTIAALIASILVFRQLQYMVDKELGFDKENVLSIKFFKSPVFDRTDKEEYEKQKNQFLVNYSFVQEEIRKHPNIVLSSRGNLPLGDVGYLMPWKNVGEQSEYRSLHGFTAAPAYERLLGLQLMEGRFFDDELDESRDLKLVINEAAKKKLGIEDITESRIANSYWGGEEEPFEVIGVVKDFHYQHLSFKIEPLIMVFMEDEETPFLLKIGAGKEKEALQFLADLYAKVNPAGTFEYTFLDDQVRAQYVKEEQLSQLYFIFTAIGLFISSIGLFTMSLYQAQRRVKEIGIRRVNGASVSRLMVLLNQDFLKWVLLAFIIACPLAWYAMDRWLQNFAYRTELSWWIFALAGLLALAVALLTVSWQSWRAASRNPVESLRYE